MRLFFNNYRYIIYFTNPMIGLESNAKKRILIIDNKGDIPVPQHYCRQGVDKLSIGALVNGR